MSNQLAVTLEKEVVRVTQNELRRALATLHAEVTALKKKVEAQERKLASVAATSSRRAAAKAPPDEGPRFTPTAIRALRKRLGLSQAALAKVVSVTPVAVYFWEAGRTTPRGRTHAALLELKTLGKKEAAARLAAAVGGSGEGGQRTAGKKARSRRAGGRKKRVARKK